MRPVSHGTADCRRLAGRHAFSIGFAVVGSRDVLRRILKEHAPEDARQQIAARVVEQTYSRAGFELDEERQVLRRRPPTRDYRSAPRA